MGTCRALHVDILTSQLTLGTWFDSIDVLWPVSSQASGDDFKMNVPGTSRIACEKRKWVSEEDAT